MSAASHLLVFRVAKQRCAMSVEGVEHVFPAVEITPLPGARKDVLGVISVHGEVVPVLSPRYWLRLPPQELRVNDRMILCQSGGRRFVLLVDAVEQVSEALPQSVVDLRDWIGQAAPIQRLMQRDCDIELRYSPEAFAVSAENAMGLCIDRQSELHSADSSNSANENVDR